MTADNGPEFTTFSKLESLGTKVYFAHPYSSWERPQNERHNGLLREFIPKRTSIEQYTDDDVQQFCWIFFLEHIIVTELDIDFNVYVYIMELIFEANLGRIYYGINYFKNA